MSAPMEPPARKAGSTRKSASARFADFQKTLVRKVPLLKRVQRWKWLTAAAVLLAGSSTLAFWQLRGPRPGSPNYHFQPQPAFSLLSASWWRAPLVIGSGRELPAFQNTTLNGVAVQSAAPDGGRPERVWVAGSNGLLAFSEDYGNCWTALEYEAKTGGFRKPATKTCEGSTAPLAAASFPRPRLSMRVWAATTEPDAAAPGRWAGDPSPEDAPSPLQITPMVVDFGRVNVNEKSASQKVILANRTKESLRLLAAGPKEGDSVGDFVVMRNGCLGREVLRPSESCAIYLYFSPQAADTRDTSFIVTDSLSRREQTVRLRGVGVPTEGPEQKALKPPQDSAKQAAAPTAPVTGTPSGSARSSWAPPANPPALLAIEFAPNGNAGVAVTDKGYAVETVDGGAGWSVRQMPSRADRELPVGRPMLLGGRHWLRTESTLFGPGTQELDRGDQQWRKPYAPICPTCDLVSYQISEGQGWAVAGRRNADGSFDSGLLFRRDTEGRWWPASRAALAQDLARRLDQEETQNGGAPLRSIHLPQPWYLLSLFLGALVAVPALLKPPEVDIATDGEDAAGVEGLLNTDRPLEPQDPDALGLRTIALGLSRFLRNKKTEPPLTIAINGEWGTGKSSLMNLLRRDLESYGFRPVWFNAWHHQKEEHLLAALLQTVRLEGVPPLSQLHGIPFRAKLLWRRMRDNLARIVVAAAVVTFVGVLEYFIIAREHNHGFLVWLLEIIADALQNPGTQGQPGLLEQLPLPWLSTVLGVGSVLRGLWNGLTAFGANPAALLTTVASGTKIRDLDAQSSFRALFASEFRDVTEALNPQRPLVIFVDDLDRCNPANVLQLLEAVNFLVSSGDCFVVIGMARGPVEGAVAYTLKDIAKWVVDPPDDVGAKKFARQYLDKLVNIEVPVPRLQDEQAERFFKPPEKQPEEPLREKAARWSLQAVQLAVPVTIGVLLLVGAWRSGLASVEPVRNFMNQWEEAKKTSQQKNLEAARQLEAARNADLVNALANVAAAVQQSQGGATRKGAPGQTDQAAQEAPGKSTGAAASQPSSTAATSAAASQTSSVEPKPVIRSGQRPRSSLWLQLSPSYLAAIFLLLVLQFVLTTRPGVVTEDSSYFTDALNIWHPLVVAHQNTPRAAKRFINRVRFLAMRQSVGRVKSGWWERALFPQRLETEPENDKDKAIDKVPANGQPKRIPEPLLVALAAIEQIQPTWVYQSEAAKGLVTLGGPPSEKEKEAIRECFLKARQAHQKLEKENEKWPKWEDVTAHRSRFLEIWPEIR